MLGFRSRFLAGFPTTWPVSMGILHRHIYRLLHTTSQHPPESFSTVTLSIHFKDIPILTTYAFLYQAPALFPYISNCGVMTSRSSSDCTLNLFAVHISIAHFFQHFPPQPVAALLFLSLSQCEFGFGRSQRPPYWITLLDHNEKHAFFHRHYSRHLQQG